MVKSQQLKFDKNFSHGCEMWTSEDGTLLSIAIKPRPDWQEVLKLNHPQIFSQEVFDEKQAKPTFVKYVMMGKEFFDGRGSSGTRGKVWLISKEPTDFPVINYELKQPR